MSDDADYTELYLPDSDLDEANDGNDDDQDTVHGFGGDEDEEGSADSPQV